MSQPSPASSPLSKSYTACSRLSHNETYKPWSVRDFSQISTAGESRPRQQPIRGPQERKRMGRGHQEPEAGPTSCWPSRPSALREAGRAEGSTGPRSSPGPEGTGRQQCSEQTETGREQAGAARDRVSLYRRLRGRTSEKGTLRRVWVEQLEAGWAPFSLSI